MSSFGEFRSQALLELDTTHLAEVMDGDYLANVERTDRQPLARKGEQ